jgi:hypothetical protein
VTAAAAPSGAPARLTPASLDALLDELWRASGVTPAPPADDAEFLRRATLDVVGRVPTLAEVERFLADTASSPPDRRARLVDALLASPEYAEHAADISRDLLIGSQLRRPALEKRLDPRAYFVTALGENRAWDRIARELLTFSGEVTPGGPGVFLTSHIRGGGPEALASATARLFLGLQLQCAQCHDHPYDTRYKQADFYGLVAYFARTRAREERDPRGGRDRKDGDTGGNAGRDMDGDMRDAGALEAEPARTGGAKEQAAKRYFVLDRPKGEAKLKRGAGADETVIAPRFLGRDLQPIPGEGRRDTVGRAVVESDLFAKSAVNRTWARLLGRGLVEPWDDLGAEADPRHPPLLVRLAADFRTGGHDLKQLLRLVLLSRAYGATSRAPPGPEAARLAALFARAVPRRLTPQQLFRSLVVATGADPQAERKIERLAREYRYVFGDDEGAEVNALSGNIPQALLLWNGEVTNRGVEARRGGTLGRILAESAVPETRLRRIFLAAYSRPPTDAERERFLPAVAGSAAADACEDLFFALLTSSEMITNH